jgi:pantothenate kinase
MREPPVLVEPALAELIARARAMATAEPQRRRLLGITGPPGAGKSALAEAIVAALGDLAALVTMDGFHLSNDALIPLGLRDRKGAPATVDAQGFASLLARLCAADEPVVTAPVFRRDLDRSIEDAIAVPRAVPLVVTEGNYLLLTDGPWARIRQLLDEAWYLVGDERRVERLIARHVAYGKAPADARGWVQRSDEANARIVEETRGRADLVVLGLPNVSPRGPLPRP